MYFTILEKYIWGNFRFWKKSFPGRVTNYGDACKRRVSSIMDKAC